MSNTKDENEPTDAEAVTLSRLVRLSPVFGVDLTEV